MILHVLMIQEEDSDELEAIQVADAKTMQKEPDFFDDDIDDLYLPDAAPVKGHQVIQIHISDADEARIRDHISGQILVEGKVESQNEEEGSADTPESKPGSKAVIVVEPNYERENALLNMEVVIANLYDIDWHDFPSAEKTREEILRRVMAGEIPQTPYIEAWHKRLQEV